VVLVVVACLHYLYNHNLYIKACWLNFSLWSRSYLTTIGFFNCDVFSTFMWDSLYFFSKSNSTRNWVLVELAYKILNKLNVGYFYLEKINSQWLLYTPMMLMFSGEENLHVCFVCTMLESQIRTRGGSLRIIHMMIKNIDISELDSTLLPKTLRY
jgi:hypothetical protein